MKTTLKTLTALGLICFALNSVQAEDTLKENNLSKSSLKAEKVIESLNSFVQKKLDEVDSMALGESNTSQKVLTSPTHAFQTSLRAIKPQFENLMQDIHKKMSVKENQI